jgi:histone acetyltransferase
VFVVGRFLNLLEEEVYSSSSPIWDPDFNQNPSNLPISSSLGKAILKCVFN